MPIAVTTAVFCSQRVALSLRYFGRLLATAVLCCAVIAAAASFHSSATPTSSPRDVENSLGARLSSIALSASPDLAQEIRFLTVTNPRLRFAAVWRDGLRVYPEQGALMSLMESKGLQQVGGRFEHLLELAQTEREPRFAALYFAGQPAEARCWRAGPSGVALGICMLQDSDTLLGSVGGAEQSMWSVAGPGLLFSVTLLLGLLLFLRRCLLEWVHDARQPLCNIRLHLDLLNRVPDRAGECRAVLYAETSRLDCTLQKLARWHSVRSCFAACRKPELGDLRDVLSALALQRRSALIAANCSLTVDLGNCPVRMIAVDALQRIVSNVLDNCARHSPGSAVSVVCQLPRAASDWLSVDVVCHGAVGAVQAVASRVERSAHPARELRSSHCGAVGLRSCRRLARSQGWRISVQSDHQRFVVSLALPPGRRSGSDLNVGSMACCKS